MSPIFFLGELRVVLLLTFTRIHPPIVINCNREHSSFVEFCQSSQQITEPEASLQNPQHTRRLFLASRTRDTETGCAQAAFGWGGLHLGHFKKRGGLQDLPVSYPPCFLIFCDWSRPMEERRSVNILCPLLRGLAFVFEPHEG